jgi:hypothetical protein
MWAVARVCMLVRDVITECSNQGSNDSFNFMFRMGGRIRAKRLL